MTAMLKAFAGTADVWEAAGNLPPGLAAPLFAYLALLFDARDLPSLRAAALAARTVIPGTTTYFREVDLATGATLTLGEPAAIGSPEVAAAYVRLRDEHPVVAYYERAGADARPLAVSDLTDEAAFCSTPLYTDLFRDFGMRDQLMIRVPLRHGLARTALCIGRESWGFSHDEHVAAIVIQRALRVTFGALIRRGSAQVARSVTTDVLARSGVQICVVDRYGDIVGHDGEAMRVDPVIVDAIRPLARLAGATHGPHASAAPVIAELKLDDDSGAPLTLQLLASDDGEFWPVMLRRSSTNGRVASLVARGLTQRQAEVMALLLSGRSTAGAALELGISPRTAEKHIVLACQALGVHTRTQALVALASGGDGIPA